MDINYDVTAFISKYRYFEKAWGSHFADIIKLVTFFIKIILKNSRKAKIIKNFVSKCNLHMHFLI